MNYYNMCNIKYKNTDYRFNYKYIDYEINQISVKLELKRYQLMNKIKDELNIILQDILPININNILPRWIMLQFRNKIYYIDPIFPYNGDDNSQLKKDLLFFSNNQINVDEIINKLNFTQKCNNCIDELRNYIKSDYNIKIKIDIKKENDFYFFIVDNYEFKLHQCIIKKLLSLNKFGNKIDEFFIENVVCIIIRYNTLESNNQQLAVNPKFYKYLQNNYNIDFELFASPINSYFTNYCSLFFDLEKNFNSKGNFTNLKLKKGFYVANPPYDEMIMKNMTIKILNSLDKTKHSLSFLIIIPVWDDIKYNENETTTMIKKSKYLIYLEKIKKQRAKFFNYLTYKYIYPCDIYIILLQNQKALLNNKIDLKKIINKFY